MPNPDHRKKKQCKYNISALKTITPTFLNHHTFSIALILNNLLISPNIYHL